VSFSIGDPGIAVPGVLMSVYPHSGASTWLDVPVLRR